MKKMIFVLLALGVVGLPMIVEAQSVYGRWNPRMGDYSDGYYDYSAHGGRLGGVYYDPRYYDPRFFDPRLHNLKELPPLELEECRYAECNGLKGTFHAEKGVLHFRPYDSTHNPFNENHKNCLEVHSRDQISSVPAGPAPVSEARPEGRLERQPSAPRRIVSSGVPLQNKMMRNKSDYKVRVYQGAEMLAELNPGDSVTKEVGYGPAIWAEAYLQNDKNDKWEWTVIQEGRGIYKLPANAGWEFADPNKRPSL